MNNFTFYSPTYFEFGKGKETEIGKLIKRFGGTKVLLHFGGGSIKHNGCYDAVTKSLDDSNIPYICLGGVMPNPRDTLVYEGIKLCKTTNVDFILAVGGGSTIDSSKAIAAGALYDGDFWDFYNGTSTVTEALPVGIVLTISAAGSEGSGNSVITKTDGLLKRGTKSEALRPRFAIMNPEYTCSLPPYQTACGLTDIMVHVIERYFTNTENVEITDQLCEGIMRTIIKEGPKVMENPNDYHARANIMWAGMLAHNDVCGVGREQDWSSHKLEHELSAMYDVAHGAGLAIITPAWMQYVYKENVDRFVRFAKSVWELSDNNEDKESLALMGIQCFRDYLLSIGMPSSLKEIGVKQEDLIKMVETSDFDDENPLGFFKKLNVKDMVSIYQMCYEK